MCLSEWVSLHSSHPHIISWIQSLEIYENLIVYTVYTEEVK